MSFLKKYRQYDIYNDKIYQDIQDDISEKDIVISDTWNIIWENVRESVDFVIDDVLDASFNDEYYISITVNIKSSVLKSLKY